ncbi:uncharacterized [Tachysurus ichikawai]
MLFAILAEVSGPWRRREEHALQASEGLISDPAFCTLKKKPRREISSTDLPLDLLICSSSYEKEESAPWMNAVPTSRGNAGSAARLE